MNNEPVAWMLLRDGSCVETTEWFGVMRSWEEFLGDNEKIVELYTHPVKEKDRFPKNFWEDTSATLENIQRADYIFTHYAKSDIIALARDLDRRDAKIAHPVKELTDEEIKQIWYDLYPLSSSSYWDDKREGLAELKFARAILRKAQEK